MGCSVRNRYLQLSPHNNSFPRNFHFRYNYQDSTGTIASGLAQSIDPLAISSYAPVPHLSIQSISGLEAKNFPRSPYILERNRVTQLKLIAY